MKTLLDLAIVITGAAFFWHTLNIHDHACEACGTSWSHVGAFSGGNERAHTCACGAVQWWRVGEPILEHTTPFAAVARAPEHRDRPRRVIG